LITLAGQTGRDVASGGVLSSDIKEQARIAYRNVANCLAAAGASPRDIIHVRHYIVKSTGNAEVDAEDVVDRGWGPMWIEFMDREADGHRPPDTVVGVASLAKAELLYEVEAWAVIHS
jgi:enamine deaminase RidA (YjgF/YER057c/UK114 family)